jgi:integrase
MASISKDKNGNRTIQFIAADRKRRSIRLGKISDSKARTIKGHIEELNAANILQETPARKTIEWVRDRDDRLAAKLAGVGLIQPRTPKAATALGPYVDDYLAKRIDVKPGTREVWERAAKNLKDHFGAGCDMATIDEGRAEDFRLYLVGEGYAVCTIHKRIEHCRMFFRSAVKRKLIADNPFADLKTEAGNAAEKRYVTREETERIVAVCNTEWAAIVSLARYGGLRCPNEVLSLRWQDIAWDTSRIVVTCHKTARRRPYRTIPLFPELVQPLRDLLELASPGAEFLFPERRAKCLTAKGWRNINLRTQFHRILKRAGFAPWSSPFNSLRSSRETELAREWPIHVVTACIGNSPKIAMKHYLMTTESDFERAAKSGAHADGDGGQRTAKAKNRHDRASTQS